MNHDSYAYDFSSEMDAAPSSLFGSASVPFSQAGSESLQLDRMDPDIALQHLHREYSQRIYNYALSMLRSREDAEDAVQTTFMNAFGSLQEGRLPRQESSWLFRIARNVCLNRIRTQQRKPASTIEGVDVAGGVSVDDAVEQRLHVRALRAALERLPDQQRKAIVMRELQGATYAEIADALDTTQGAVESLIFRARRHLAGALDAVQIGNASPIAA